VRDDLELWVRGDLEHWDWLIAALAKELAAAADPLEVLASLAGLPVGEFLSRAMAGSYECTDPLLAVSPGIVRQALLRRIYHHYAQREAAGRELPEKAGSTTARSPMLDGSRSDRNALWCEEGSASG
jgi:hypothetical protein